MENDVGAPEVTGRKYRDIAGLAVFVLFAVAMAIASLCTPLGEFASMANISAMTDKWGLWGPMAIMVAGIVTAMLMLPRWPVAFVSGLIYGITAGALFANVAALLGAAIHYVLAKTLLAGLADRMIRRYPTVARNMRGEKLFVGLFLARALPFSSFVVTNLVAGAMRVRFWTYIGASFLGMIPSSVMYAAWGKSMKKPTVYNYSLAVLLLLIITIATIVAKRRVAARDSAEDQGIERAPKDN